MEKKNLRGEGRNTIRGTSKGQRGSTLEKGRKKNNKALTKKKDSLVERAVSCRTPSKATGGPGELRAAALKSRATLRAEPEWGQEFNWTVSSTRKQRRESGQSGAYTNPLRSKQFQR